MIAGVMALVQTEIKNQDDKAKEPANLVIPSRQQPVRPHDVRPAADHMPWGPGLSTPVPFRNDGNKQALVRQVILTDCKWVPTPHRDDLRGAVQNIRVVFGPGNYVERVNQYMLVLQEPAPAPGGEWTTLNVAFVDPKKVGRTLVTTVTIIYDGQEQTHVKGVQLDALREPPKKIGE
jgi:hypothetical protein